MYLPQWQNAVEKQFAGRSSTYSLSGPTVWQKCAVFCSIMIRIGIYVLMARTLVPRMFGSYLFAQWLASVAVPIIGAGMSTLASRQLADIQSRESPRLVAGIFCFLWYRQHRSILLYSLVYLLMAFPLSQFLPVFTRTLLLLAGLATLPLLLSNVVGTTLRSLRRADLLVLLHLFGALLTLFLVIIASQVEGKPVEAFLLAFALSGTLTLILAVFCVIHLLPLEKALKPGIFLQEKLVSSLHHGWLPFLLDVIIWQYCELFLLAWRHNPAELGFYTLSALISTGVMFLTLATFTHILLPLFFHLLPQHHYLNPYDAFVKTSCTIVFWGVFICSVMILISPTLIKYSLGEAYLPLVNSLRFLLIAPVFGSIASISITQLIQRGQPGIHLWLNGSIALGKIILTLPMVTLWGMTGVAFCSALAQIACALVAVCQCHQCLRHYDGGTI